MRRAPRPRSRASCNRRCAASAPCGSRSWRRTRAPPRAGSATGDRSRTPCEPPGRLPPRARAPGAFQSSGGPRIAWRRPTYEMHGKCLLQAMISARQIPWFPLARNLMHRSFSVVFGLLSVSSLASAQQFQHQPGWLPGPARWSEGVEAADVDHDGDLDLFVADGEGFSSAGAKRQNLLVINKLVESGPGIFVDESVARLGTHLSNAKGVITGDVDGDGWVDAIFLNAFRTDLPSLYVNRGAA